MLKLSNKQKALIQYIGYPILVIGVLFLIVLSFIPPKGYFTELRPVSMSRSDFEMNTGIKILEPEVDTVSGLSEQHQFMGEGVADYLFYYDEQNEKEYLGMKPFGGMWHQGDPCDQKTQDCNQFSQFPEQSSINIIESKKVYYASKRFENLDWFFMYLDTDQNIIYFKDDVR